MSQKAVAEPAAFERANYMKALSSFDNRILHRKCSKTKSPPFYGGLFVLGSNQKAAEQFGSAGLF